MSDNYQRHKRQQKGVLVIQGDKEKTKDQIDSSLWKGKKPTGCRELQYPAPCVPHSFQLILTVAGVHGRTGDEQVKEM